MRTSDAIGAQPLDCRNTRKSSSAGTLLSPIYATGASATEPQRRDGRREKSKGEGAQSDHSSATCLQVAGTPLALHCKSGNCSQAATNLRKETNRGIRETRGSQTESWPDRIMQRGKTGERSSMILSGHDSVISSCGFPALRSSRLCGLLGLRSAAWMRLSSSPISCSAA
jgi:hypothetical protein